MQIDKIKENLNTKLIGKKLYYYKEIDSTNDEAKRLLKLGAGEGTVVIASEQKAGKGRLGRSWLSPKGGLYLSIIIKPHMGAKEILDITLLGSLAAARAIRGLTKLDARVSWPNDIIIFQKKVGGVLTEISSSGKGPNSVIVGIGINVNIEYDKFPKDLVATSLKIELGQSIDKQKVATIFLEEFDKLYLAYLSKKRKEIIEEWKTLSLDIGKWVKVLKEKEEIEGKVTGIGTRGELILRGIDGKIKKLTSGEVVKVK